MRGAQGVLVIGAVSAVVALNGAQRRASPLTGAGQPARQPPSEVLDVRSGALTLRAQLWPPSGSGPFPAILFNHGSYSTNGPLPPSDPETLGALFARHGYVFLWLHRQGTGLSSGQGMAEGDQLGRAFQADVSGCAGRRT